MSPDEVKVDLVKVLEDPSSETVSHLLARSNAILEYCRSTRIETDANISWYLYTLLRCLLEYLAAVEKIKSGYYYEAWCSLERIEIAISHLKRNPFQPEYREFVDRLGKTVSAWQELYPYAVFFSPEIIIKRKTCSICAKPITPWDDCGHRRGFVYSGVLCHSNVEKMEFRGISMVSKPVQKFSVAFTSDENGNRVDHYDYAVVKFVADRLVNPMDSWEAYWTEAYHAHELFSEFDSEDSCPCGSGVRYQSCCLKKPGVKRPHLQVRFERIKDSLPGVELAGYEKNKDTPT